MAKKILFLRTPPYDLNPKSYNNQQIGLGKALCRMGYDFDFVTFKKKDQKEWVFFEENGCRARYIEMPRRRFMRWGYNKDVLRKEFIEQYDVILSQEYYQIMTYLISRKSNKVVMYSGPYTNLFMLPFSSSIYDFIFTKRINQQINLKLAKSELAKLFLEEKGYTNVHTVGVGLDYERFDEEKEIRPETQKIVDYMKSNKCILYVGSLWSVKNYPFLLKVYEKILKRDHEVKFVIIGKSKASAWAKLIGKTDESYAEGVEKKLPERVRNGIYHVSRIDNPQLKYVYPHAKAFLLPSKFEIFGMVLMEAMYLGAPVVTGKNGGSTTLFGDSDQYGQIVEQFNADLWADAVMRYLRHPDYAKQVVECAKRKVVEEYNWNVRADKIISLIKKVGLLKD